jgi:hypothetical protein
MLGERILRHPLLTPAARLLEQHHGGTFSSLANWATPLRHVTRPPSGFRRTSARATGSAFASSSAWLRGSSTPVGKVVALLTPLDQPGGSCASMPSSLSSSGSTPSIFSSLAIAATSSALRARLRSSLTVFSSNASISSNSLIGT